MSLKSLLAQPFASYVSSIVKKESKQAIEHQDKIRTYLITQAKQTQFGKDHFFHQIHSQNEFASAIPIRDYEEFRPYIEKIKEGRDDILWRGQPVYLDRKSVV